MTTLPGTGGDGRPTWRAILPLCLMVFALLVHGSALGPLAAAMARDLGTSIPLIGQVTTLIFTVMGVTSLLSGPLADHFGHRRGMLVGLGLLGVSAALMALAPTYAALLAAGLVTGIGAAAMGLPFAVAAARYAGDARREALGRIQATQTAGAILGAPILTAIAAASIWRASFLVVLAAYFVATALIARTMPRDARGPSGRFTPRTILASYRPVLRDRRLQGLYGASALRAIGWVGPFTYLGAFFAEVRGLSLRQIGIAYMVASGGMFAGNLAAGRLRGVGLRPLFALATALTGLAWFAVFALPLSVPWTVSAVTVAACAAGIGWICLTTLLASVTTTGQGTTMTLNSAVFGLGSALGGALGGLLVGLGGYRLLGLALPGCTVVAALLVWQPRFLLWRPSPVATIAVVPGGAPGDRPEG